MHDWTAPSADDISLLASITGPTGVREGEAAAPYLQDPRDQVQGQAAIVLRPQSTSQVASIVRHCAERRIGIVPHGGGTGLVGGQTQPTGVAPVIVSLDRMTAIRAVVPEENALIAEAGVILADVQAAAERAGRLFPLSLAAEGSCRIGGNLSTNAGGVQVLRYGNARDLCLGLEAVLPNGEILQGLKTLRKDNTGYDLRHLLIGAEGTLGIITAAALKLFPRPGATVTAMLAVRSPTDAVDLLSFLRDELGDAITAFELIQARGVDFLNAHHEGVVDPLDDPPEWRVLVEVIGPTESGLEDRVEASFAVAFEKGLATDGVLASSEAQRQQMWWLRETIPEANRKVGAVSNHDISVPIGRIAAFIDDGITAIEKIDPSLRINCFGHLGDGNLHYNVFPAEGRRRDDYVNRRPEIKTAIHDLVHAHGGSVSAEHGIGRFKTEDLVKYGDPAKLAAMRAIKDALDPNGIMNPGAVLAS
ncbi:MAG: FAD-binding oxidoreductase [Pseudomonadota bacterium]